MNSTDQPGPGSSPGGREPGTRGEEAGSAPRARVRRRWIVLGSLGALIAAFLIAAFIDYSSFDQTSGGYDPPYTDWTGTPIDWDEAEVTDEGFHRSGIVLDDRLNCTTGMISFRVAKLLTFNFRQVSERAIAVHKPREACRDAGFDPEF